MLRIKLLGPPVSDRMRLCLNIFNLSVSAAVDLPDKKGLEVTNA